MRYMIIMTLFMLCLNPAWASKSTQTQSINSLKDMAQRYLQQQIGGSNHGRVIIKVGHLDSRLKLAHCQMPDIEAFLPPGSQATTATTVGIRCNSAQSWSLYVPVKVKIVTQVLVTTRPIGRGSRLMTGDLKLADYDVRRLKHGYFRDKKPLMGQFVKRPLRIGIAIAPTDVQIPNMVLRGENVIISAQAGGIRVNMHGKALMNGRYGDTIRVRSKNSKTIIQARVIGAKQVEVLL